MLAPAAELTLWSEGFFTPGELTLETLEQKSRLFDGAIVVATADDTVVSRGTAADSIRDNLLFEFGLFVSMFGRRRAILMVEGLGSTRLPSDLFGLTCVSFSVTDPPEAGLSDAADQLETVAARLAEEVVDARLREQLDAVARGFLWDFQGALGVTSELGLHVWVVDERSTPPELVRAARARSSPKAALGRSYPKSVGLVGHCWETGSPVFVDFDQEPYRSADAAQWAAFGPEVKCGMEYSLLDESRKRFRAVGAAPVVSNLNTGLGFLGCISYNVGKIATDMRSRSVELEGAINRTTEMVRILLESDV